MKKNKMISRICAGIMAVMMVITSVPSYSYALEMESEEIAGSIDILDGNGTVVWNGDSLLEAKKYVESCILDFSKEQEKGSDPLYTLRFGGDVTGIASDELEYCILDGEGQSVIQDYSSYVKLDLNGYTLCVNPSESLFLRVSKVENGTILLEENARLFLCGNYEKICEASKGYQTVAEKYEYTNVRFTGSGKEEVLMVGGGVLLQKDCSISDISALSLGASGEIACDFSVEQLYMLGSWNAPGHENPDTLCAGSGYAVLSGTVTTQYLWVRGVPSDLADLRYRDTAKEDASKQYGYKQEYGAVFFQMTVTSGAKFSQGSENKVYKTLKVSGDIYIYGGNEAYWESFDAYPEPKSWIASAYPATFALMRCVDAEGNTLSMGQIDFSGTLNEYEVGEGKLYIHNEEVENELLRDSRTPAIDILPVNVTPDGIETESKFTSEETIGTLNLQGILHKNGKTAEEITEQNLAEYVNVVTDREPENSPILEEPVAAPESLSVQVVSPDGKTESYISLKTAVEALDSLEDKKEGTYTFLFSENQTISEDITLPAYVTKAIICAAQLGENNRENLAVTIDLDGAVLTVPGEVLIEEGVFFSSVGNQGTILLTSTSESRGLAFSLLDMEAPLVTTQGIAVTEEERRDLIRNVKVISSHAKVYLENSNGIAYQLDELDAAIVLKSGSWIANTITSAKTILTAGSRLAVLKSAVFDGTTLAMDASDNAKQAFLYIADQAELSLNGTFEREREDLTLAIGRLASSDGSDWNIVAVSDETELFQTDIAEFPTDMITLQIVPGVTDTYVPIEKEIGAVLSYRDEKGKKVSINCFTFAAAVNEINNLSVKRDYHILVNEYATEDIKNTQNAIAALTMPKKNCVSTLTIEGKEGDAKEPVELRYSGNLAITTNTVLKNVSFVRTEYNKSTKQNVEISANKSLTTKLTVNGSKLTFAGEVLFNTSLAINGGKTGTLIWTEDGRVYTLTKEKTKEDLKNAGATETYISGTISSFGSIVIPRGCVVTTNACSATEVHCEGELLAVGSGANVAITNLIVTDGTILSDGKMTLNKVTLESREEGGKTILGAISEFSILKSLTSNTGSATLYTRQISGKKTAPYLNISGTVMLKEAEDVITVGVARPTVTSASDLKTNLATLQGEASILLTAKSAKADQFAPEKGNLVVNEKYSGQNPDGYIIIKNGSNMYVNYGTNIKAAVCEGDASDGKIDAASILGFYLSYADAVKGIDAKKDKNAEYTILLLQDVGERERPVSLTFPTYAAKVHVTGMEGKKPKVYYTNTWSLKTDTFAENITLVPVALNKSTKQYEITQNLGVALNACELVIAKDVAAENGIAAFQKVTGKAKSKLTIAQEEFYVGGSISGCDVLELAEGSTLSVHGAVKVKRLIMNGKSVLDASQSTGAVVTLGDVSNNGISENTILYTRNAKGISNLTVNGLVDGENPYAVALDLIAPEAAVSEYVYRSSDAVVEHADYERLPLTDSRKLATLTKAATLGFSYAVNGFKLGAEEDCVAIKANKGVYMFTYVNERSNPMILESIVKLTRTESADAKKYESYYLDFSQAIAEISNLGDATAKYEIWIGRFSAEGDCNVLDLNLTDTRRHTALLLPKDSKAAGITIYATGETRKLYYTGAVTAYGDLTFKKVELCAMKNNVDDTVGTSALTMKKNTKKKSYTGSVLTMEDSKAVFDSAKIYQLHLKGTKSEAESYLKVAKASTIESVKAGGLGEIYLESTQITSKGGRRPALTISGAVVCENGMSALPIKITGVKEDAYTNVNLAVAPKAASTSMVAFGYRNSQEEIVTYKDKNHYVKSGRLSDLAARITKVGEDGETYAASLADAVAFINGWNDAKGEYFIELLQEEVRISGSFLSPSKAKSVTYTGKGKKGTLLSFSGSLSPNCNVVLNRIILPQNVVIDTGKKVVSVGFAGNTRTLDQELRVSEIRGNKGAIELYDTTLFCDGNMNIPTLKIYGSCGLKTFAKTTLTDVSGKTDTAMLDWETMFSSKTASIKGKVKHLALHLIDRMPMENEAGEKALLSLPAAGTECISFLGEEGKLYKNGGILYVTKEKEKIAVELQGTDSRKAVVYDALFTDYDQAVKEIDRRADSAVDYTIILKKNIGDIHADDTPLSAVNMPSKAKSVTLTSENGKQYVIFTTAKKISLKTKTRWENMGVVAYKKKTVSGKASYEMSSYTLDAGKMNFSQKDISLSDNCSVITGKGSYVYVVGDGAASTQSPAGRIMNFANMELYNSNMDDMANANQEISVCIIPNGITGIGTLKVYPGVWLSIPNADFSVKNLDIYGSKIEAKNVTVSGTTILESARICAGTKSIGDGKMKLKTVIAEDAKNILSAKQDKNGKSMLVITGKVTTQKDAPIIIGIFYSDQSSYAKLHDKMVLLLAQSASAECFVPYYSTTEYDEEWEEEIYYSRMGEKQEGYGLIKSGKTIWYQQILSDETEAA